MSNHLNRLATLLQQLALAPQDGKLWCQVGFIYMQIGDPAEALATFHSAQQIAPTLADAYFGEAFVHFGLGNPDRASQLLTHAIRLAPNDQRLYSAYAHALSASGAEPATILQAYQTWGQRFTDPLRPKHRPPARRRQAGERIRIGYLSADFRQHALMSFFAPILAHHDRECFQIIAFSSTQPDELTPHIRTQFDHWNDIQTLSDKDAADLIRRRGIDILVDLSGHTDGTRLLAAARQPAPIQMTWYGYNCTTGTHSIDYRLTDTCMDPIGNETWATEQLIRLPTFTTYQPPAVASEITALPAEKNGYVTFGSLNAFHKLSDTTLRCWADLLAHLPNARLLIIGPHAESAGPASVAPAKQRLLENGLPLDRTTLLPRQSFTDFMALGQKIDIALEPMPLTGGVTTCHTLWMGLPTLTLAGNMPDTRAATAILSAANCACWITTSKEEYIEVAKNLSLDIAALAQLRATLRNRLQQSPLMDHQAFTRAFEAQCRTMIARLQ